MSPWWYLVCLAILLIGVTKSGFGAGLGLIVVPMTILAMKHIPGTGSGDALPLILPLLIVGDILAIWQYRRFADLKLIRRMLPGTIIGIGLGTLLIYMFNKQPPKLTAILINLEIGIESIILVSIHWWRQWRGVQVKLMPEPWRSWSTTAFAGASSTLAHAAGPVIAMYLLPLQLVRQVQVATSAAYFFFTNCAKCPTYWMTGLFGHVNPWFSLSFAPLVIVGALMGKWINKRMSDKLFTRLVYVCVFVLGWYIVVTNGFDLRSYWRG